MKRLSIALALGLLCGLLASPVLAQGLTPTATPTPIVVQGQEIPQVTIKTVTPVAQHPGTGSVVTMQTVEPTTPCNGSLSDVRNLPYTHLEYGLWHAWPTNGQEVVMAGICTDGTFVVVDENHQGMYFMAPERDATNHYSLRIDGKTIDQLVGQPLWVIPTEDGNVVIQDLPLIAPEVGPA
jgi:hypothetical protein